MRLPQVRRGVRVAGAALLAFAGTAVAAPYVVTDPLMSHVTHCGVLVDAQPKVTIPVVVQGADKICRFDLAGLAAGSHTVKMTAIANDPVYGTKESAESLPLSFVVPVVPSAPANLRLVP